MRRKGSICLYGGPETVRRKGSICLYGGPETVRRKGSICLYGDLRLCEGKVLSVCMGT